MPAGFGCAMIGQEPTSASPSSISGLQVWLDSTVGLTTGAWTDQSTNAYSFTGHGTPTINASDASFGNKQTVTLSSVVSQYYSLTSPNVLNTPSTVIVAFKYTGTSAATSIVGNNASGSNILFPGINASNAYTMTNGGVNTISGGSTDSSVHIIAAVVDSTPNWTIYLDGAVIVGPTSETTLTPSGMNVGAAFAGFSTGDYFSGTLASVLVYNSALSTANLATVRSYLKNEFNI